MAGDFNLTLSNKRTYNSNTAAAVAPLTRAQLRFLKLMAPLDLTETWPETTDAPLYTWAPSGASPGHPKRLDYIFTSLR